MTSLLSELPHNPIRCPQMPPARPRGRNTRMPVTLGPGNLVLGVVTDPHNVLMSKGTPTFALRSAGGRAVTASPSRVLGDGVPQVAAVDVWPEAGGEGKFGVRGVPGEEVGRA